MKKFRNILLLLGLGFFLATCTDKDESIDPGGKYHFVSDLVHYCQGSCEVTDGWENAGAWVKGFIRDAENDSVMQSNRSQSKFYLLDVRNGMFMEISVVERKAAIFDKLALVNKTDQLFLKGIAMPVFAFENENCKKGVVLTINHPDHILINEE